MDSVATIRVIAAIVGVILLVIIIQRRRHRVR
jgi:hypothetical protein